MSLVRGQEGWRRWDHGRGDGRGASQAGAATVGVGGGFGAGWEGVAEARGFRVRCFVAGGCEGGGEAGVIWSALRVCVRSASASGSEGAFAFVGDFACGFGDSGSWRATAAGSLSPLFDSFVSVFLFFLRELFDFFGVAFAFAVPSGAGSALVSLFTGELFLELLLRGFSLSFPSFPPSTSAVVTVFSTFFSSSTRPSNFCGAGDESCKKIPALLDTCFFFPYTLAVFFGGRWVSIVSGGRRSFGRGVLRCANTLVVGVVRKWDGGWLWGLLG